MNSKEWYEKIWKLNINELNGKTYYTVSNDQEKKEVTKMTKKFTEEQYQAIVEAWDSKTSYAKATKAVIETINQFNNRLDLNSDQALALANQLTREWAHKYFVEKEKKYVWRDKYTGYVIYKMLNDWSLSATALGEKHFTETELKNSPFKPEWFDREEV